MGSTAIEDKGEDKPLQRHRKETKVHQSKRTPFKFQNQLEVRYTTI